MVRCIVFLRNIGAFFLEDSCEKQGFVCGDDVGRALHAAWAELGVAEPLAPEGLLADLT